VIIVATRVAYESPFLIVEPAGSHTFYFWMLLYFILDERKSVYIGRY